MTGKPTYRDLEERIRVLEEESIKGKQAEKALSKSEQQYRTLVDNIPDYVMRYDRQHRHIFVNQKTLTANQKTSDEFIGKTHRELGFPAHLCDTWERVIDHVFRTGEPQVEEFKWESKTGTVVLEWKVCPEYVPDGTIETVLGTSHDITYRKQAEAALRKSEERYRRIVDTTSEGVWTLDENFRITYVNKRMAEMLGYEPQEMIGKNADLFGLAKDVPTRSERRNRRKQGISEQFDRRFRRKDGSTLWAHVSATPVLDDNGRFAGSFSMHTDITQRKEAEEALKESEERFRIIASSTPDHLIVQNRDLKYTLVVNPQLGLTEQDMLGKTDHAFLGEEDANVLTKMKKQVLETGKPVSVKVPLLSKTGKKEFFEGSYIPKYDADGHTDGLIGYFRNVTERVEAEQLVRESEEKYRRIVDTTSEGIWTLDENFLITYANKQMAEMLGYEPDELIGKNVRSFGFDEDIPTVLEARNRRKQGISEQFDRKFRRKDGSTIWAHISATPTTDDNGRFAGSFAMHTDITERKRAEADLKASKDFMRAVLDNLNDFLLVIDPVNYTILRANKAFIDSYGLDNDTVIGKRCYELTHNISTPCSLPDHICPIEETLRTGKHSTVEHIHYDSTGSKLYAEVSAIPIISKAGEIDQIIHLSRDITERKHAEEELMESEEYFRGLIENSTDNIMVFDADNIIRYQSPSVERSLGYRPEETIGTNRGSVIAVHPDDIALILNDVEKAMHNPGVAVGPNEVRFRHKNGSWRWREVLNMAVVQKSGQMILVGNSRDITERKQAEEEKARLAAQLLQSQKMEAIGTLAGGVAHDFNNILTALIGYGTLLRMSLEDSPLRVYADQILSSSEKAAQLTQSLLAFSRKQPITLKPLKLNDIVKGTEKLLKRLLTEDIVLKTNLAADDPTVMGDATQIDQILINLATNARDAMPKGGILTVETQRVELDKELLDIHEYVEPGTYALISISDTGVGIDEATKEHIFDPFFTTKEVGKGTGLGLSTVYGIVKQHKGYVNVHSEPNIGTTFYIYLPAITVATEEEKPVSPLIAKGGKETILIAEDNEGVRGLMRTILARQGYTVIEAVDGKDAIDKFYRHKDVDLLIIDSVMPKKNGREVYDEIRRAYSRIKVLFTSGYTKDVVLDKGVEEKEFDFISKPLTPNELLRKVREVLDK